MSFSLTTLNTTSKPAILGFLTLIISFLLTLSHDFIAEAADITIRIGAIIDLNSRMSKEQQTAMTIAVQNFNKKSVHYHHKLSLHFTDSSRDRDPLQAAFAAEELIKKYEVQVIIGMDSWEEAALVANVGSRDRVPVLSFAAAAITPPSALLRWPFLVQMATNGSVQVDCIAAVVHSFNWRRVITIYEEDKNGGDSGMFMLLSKALRRVSVEIEYNLVLPPCSSKELILEELLKLIQTTQSRVFVVLQSSLNLTNLLFKEAKKIGLMEKESAWIVTDTIASLLSSHDISVLSSMEGALGIMPYYSETSTTFEDFRVQFRQIFEREYPKEASFEPGIHALRAYDGITSITKALKKLRHNRRNSTTLLNSLSSNNFTGFSGKIHFEERRLSQQRPIFRIINIFNKAINNNGFWSPDFGFLESLDDSVGRENDVNGKGSPTMKELVDSVKWPGDLEPPRVPKGWAMPTAKNKLKIGFPGKVSFKQFVKVELPNNHNEKKPTGYCFRVFEEIEKFLEYKIPAEFVEYEGSYDELVDRLADKTYDGIVGDITILANRSKYVDFTEPFIESGLSFIVPVKPEAPTGWMFLKPFTWEMWTATGIILIYTMFVVWFFEHRSNPEFSGTRRDQLAESLWFTFCTLFFVHKEKIQSNYTRVVVGVWLFVVLILTQSYTASFSSMLTISGLRSNLTDIEQIRSTGSIVGCDGSTFMWKYLVEELKFERKNIKNISSENDYLSAFENGSISAAFLEVPYAKVFVNKYCKRYSITPSTYRFGGFGFAFQKGSPTAVDVSDAILRLSENGKLKELEDRLFTSSSECSTLQTVEDKDSLQIQSFGSLYLISIATSTICFLSFIIHLLMNY